MENALEFWQYLDELVASSRIVIDRPQGSTHPRFPGQVYPLDYGYLDGTTSPDGGGIDIWLGSQAAGLVAAGSAAAGSAAAGSDAAGSQATPQITGVLCTVDLLKRDGELKLLIGCTNQDVQCILQFVNSHSMRAIYIPTARRHAGG